MLNRILRNTTGFLIMLLPAIPVKAQLYFPPLVGSTWDTLSPGQLNYCDERVDSLYDYLESIHTKAFILLKDGRIVLEKYFDNHTQNTPWYWASAGKSLTALLVGIAQQDGDLNIGNATADYLGENWTTCTPAQESNITVRHQLSMTTGLDDGVPNPDCTEPQCLEYTADAGSRWAYHNAPYTLLDDILYAATGMTMNQYVDVKVKAPTGMTGTYMTNGYNNVFYSNARSMARYGLLILNKGKWNNTIVLSDTNYFNDMVSTSQQLNKSYGYLWWLNGKESFMIPQSQLTFPGKLMPHAPDETIMALGKNGQFLNIVPSEKLVWLRMGDAPGDDLVPFLYNDSIWVKINSLACATTSKNIEIPQPGISLWPNPAEDILYVKSTEMIAAICITDLTGKIVYRQQSCQSQAINIPCNHIAAGVYLLKLTNTKGSVKVLMWAKK